MKLFLLLIIACSVTACSDNKSTETSQPEVEQMPTLFDAQIDALDKAESVEQSLQEMSDKRAEQMRQQGS